MTLKKRNIDVPLIGGLNQKVTDKLIAPPGLLTLENGRYLKEGRVDKRYGYNNLGLAVDSGTLNTPIALGTVNDELLMHSSDRLYSYANATSTWADRGETVQTSTSINPIQVADESIDRLEVLQKSNLIVSAWHETGSHYSVIDATTGNPIVNRGTLSGGSISSSTSYRIVATNRFFYIFFHNSPEMYARRIPINSPDTSTVINPYSSLDGDIFDVQAFGDRIYVFFKISGSSTLRVSILDEELNVLATNTISSETVTVAKSMAIRVFSSESEATDLIALGWVNSSNQVRISTYDLGLVQQVAATTVRTTTNVVSVMLAEDSTDESTIGVFFTESNATPSKHTVHVNSVTLSSGSVGTNRTFMHRVGLASKCFRYLDQSYFVVLHESTLQPTYFVVNTDAKVVAKFAASLGPTHSDITKLGSFDGSSGSYTFGVLKKNRIESENATLVSDLIATYGTLSFDTSVGPITSVVNSDYLISGGILRSYDGISATELGFHLYPEDLSATAGAGSGVPDGTYLIYAVYEWTDNRGVRHLSAPSIATSVTTGAGNNAIALTIPTLTLTDKSTSWTNLTSRRNATIRVYITEASGTVPYFLTSTTNSVTSNETSIAITTDPATLTSNEILYTTGGVVENIVPPSNTFIFTHDNRLVAVGLEDGNQIAFSKDIKPNTGSGFNEDFVLSIDPLGGRTVAGASMDNYMVIFKDTATYAISGSGPNDTGADSSYSSPQLISADIGCKDPKSVQQTSDGILLKTNKGIYLLTRSLEFMYIGAPVADYETSTILSSDVMKTSNEIRFATNQNRILVYNYFFKRWSTYTAPGIVDATTWKSSDYVYLTSTKAMKEDSTTYLDDGSYVPTKIRTGWIKLSGLQGYQRVYRAALIGEYHTNHIFQVKMYYDYSDIVRSTTNITASSLVNTSTYGDSATYGADSYFGGSANDEVYQARIHLDRQKCESISIEVVDAIQGTNIGQGFSLEGISLLVGGKSGLFRTSNTRSK